VNDLHLFSGVLILCVKYLKSIHPQSHNLQLARVQGFTNFIHVSRYPDWFRHASVANEVSEILHSQGVFFTIEGIGPTPSWLLYIQTTRFFPRLNGGHIFLGKSIIIRGFYNLGVEPSHL
jgi:hypothetical protein